MTTHEKILKARTILMWEQPFFGTLALRLELKENNKFPTAAVNTKTIFYNSLFIESLSMAEVIGVLAHEVMHVALGHPWRQDWRDHSPWNIATDYTINENLIKAGFKLPKGCLVDNSYNDLSAEEIYSKLPVESNDDDEAGDDSDSQTGDGEASSDDDSKDSSDSEDSEDSDDEDSDDAEESKDDDSEDSDDDEETDSDEAGSEDSDDDEETEDPGGCGGVLKDEESDDEEKENSQAEWQVAVSQAANVSKSEMSEGIKRQIEEHLNPSVNWAVLLRDFVEQTARTDYDWERPDEDYLQRDIYMPSLYSEELPEVCICIDTSGSIDHAALARFSKEASEVLSAYNTTIRVIYADDRVCGEEVFTNDDMPMTMHPKSITGMTDFRPVFQYIEDNDYTPACLIYFTDLHGRFPAQEADFETLWLTQTKTKTAPFGETVLFE